MEVKRVATVLDGVRECALEMLKYPDTAGQALLLTIDRDKLTKPDVIYRELSRANVAMPLDRRLALRQVEESLTDKPSARWVSAQAAGWRAGQAAFPLGEEVLGDTGEFWIFPSASH